MILSSQGRPLDQIKLLIFVPQKASQLVLGRLPFPEDISQRLGQPYLTDTGIGLGLFQDQPGAGVGHEGREDVVDILFTQGIDCPFGGLCKLLVDVNISIILPHMAGLSFSRFLRQDAGPLEQRKGEELAPSEG